MDFRDIARLQLEGIADVEARWQPTPTSNHILWMMWHLSRLEDVWFNDYITTGPDVWANSGWYERIGRAKDAHGVGDSIEDVVGFPDVPLSEIHGIGVPCVNQFGRYWMDFEKMTSQTLLRSGGLCPGQLQPWHGLWGELSLRRLGISVRSHISQE